MYQAAGENLFGERNETGEQPPTVNTPLDATAQPTQNIDTGTSTDTGVISDHNAVLSAAGTQPTDNVPLAPAVTQGPFQWPTDSGDGQGLGAEPSSIEHNALDSNMMSHSVIAPNTEPLYPDVIGNYVITEGTSNEVISHCLSREILDFIGNMNELTEELRLMLAVMQGFGPKAGCALDNLIHWWNYRGQFLQPIIKNSAQEVATHGDKAANLTVVLASYTYQDC